MNDKKKGFINLLKSVFIVLIFISIIFVCSKYVMLENDPEEAMRKQFQNCDLSELTDVLNIIDNDKRPINIGMITLSNDGFDEYAIQKYTGIVDIELVSDISMKVIEPKEKYFIMMIELLDKNDNELIIEQMKTNLHPEEWTWYDEETGSEINYWNDITVEDMVFHSNENYILVLYVDEHLVHNNEKKSPEYIIEMFDVFVDELYN